MLKKGLHWWSKKRLPQVNGRIYLTPLQAPVTIVRDGWGIVTIQAVTRHDLFVAQGFVHAQDRMWQMEVSRQAANGRLSELFGKITLESDRLTRTLGFARLARDSWQRLGTDYQADLKAYAAGVNAFLQSHSQLPIEFRLIRHQPEPWQPLDSLAYGRLQMWALTQGATAELTQAWLLDKLGEAKAQELFLHYPVENPITLPDGVVFDAAVVHGWLQTALTPFLNKEQLSGANGGSNGWVIAPERSATGHAILCNDMHLPLTTPSLWHYQQLQSQDGWHVTGFTQPGLPYVMVGHNAHIAWGATLSYVDCEDLFIEQLRDDGLAYRFEETWRPTTILEEPILVRGGRNHIERVVLTHHGPIVSGTLLPLDSVSMMPDLSKGMRVGLALQSIALQRDVDFDGFAALNQAREWPDFVAAISRIQSPSLNFLYADGADNIGHWVSGRVPIRSAGDGRVPASGWDGKHEWIDVIPFAEMPHTFNPERGYIVSANHRLVPDGCPHFLGHMWRNGYRANRIEALINAQTMISIADCQRFQLDFYSVPGRMLVDWLADFETADPQAMIALNCLRGWDGWLTAESVGGAVYGVLLWQLANSILTPDIDEAIRHQLLGLGPHPQLAPVNEFLGQWSATLLRLLQSSNSLLLPATKRPQLVETSLAETAMLLTARFGEDVATWQWGRLHQLTLPHMLGRQTALASLLNHGPFAVGGDADTVMQAGVQPDAACGVANGVSAASRMVIDLSDWHGAWGMLVPGQSGQVGSSHYGDMVAAWRSGRYWPMAWGMVEKETAVLHQILRLSPSL